MYHTDVDVPYRRIDTVVSRCKYILDILFVIVYIDVMITRPTLSEVLILVLTLSWILNLFILLKPERSLPTPIKVQELPCCSMIDQRCADYVKN